MSSRLLNFAIAVALTLLAGCATRPVQSPDRIANEPLTADNFGSKTAAQAPADTPIGGIDVSGRDEKTIEAPKPELQVGTAKFIDEAAARRPLPAAGGEGQVDFNFENNPIQAVVKAILGDLLQQNYTIAPNVGGNVSFSTSKPIRADQAMSVLEMLLSWTGNTLIYKDGRYTVLQIKDALPGNLTPRIAAPKLAKGYEVRVFPLRYVSPSEMAKLLKPYAKPEAVVNADTSRSMIVLAGTASELENYAQTIDMFDVDWMKGMSIGVFTLQRAEVTTLLPELEKIFGATGESPLAGMFRFLPIERSNAIIAMTPQPEYLRQAEDWLRRLDRAGDESMTQLFVYDVKNVKSVDLADYLNEIFLGTSGGGSRRSSTSGSVAPGLSSVTVGGGMGRAGSSRMSSRRGGASATGTTTQPVVAGATPAASGGVAGREDSGLRITAVEESNQLLVMATPIEWDAMQAAIRKLDIAPLQVHIETKILEVGLNGDLQYGVQWWFAGLRGQAPYAGIDYDVLRCRTGDCRLDRQRSGMGAPGPGETGNIFWSYLNSKFQVALSALETTGQAKVLSAPSLMVLNNQEANINVGTQIPVQQTSFVGLPVTTNGTAGTPTNTGYGTIQYLDTGVILNVKPRVNPGGLVYLEVSQEVSSQGAIAANGNPAINSRTIDTQIAVQSGDTILLGGLISEDDATTNGGVPGLSRVPVIGKLFGNTIKKKNRTELIVLITPRVMANSEEAREVTETYKQQFKGIEPLRVPATQRATPPQD